MSEPMNVSDWIWSMSAPWDPELLYEFRYLEREMVTATPLYMDDEFKSGMRTYMTHLIHLADFCGFQNTWARLAEEWNREGIPMGRAWMGASLGGQLAWAGLHQVAAQVFKDDLALVLNLTPLHFWSLVESCQWMKKDFIPQCEEAGGLPFGDPDELKQLIEIVEARFRPVKDVLDGEFDPYSRIRLVQKTNLNEVIKK